MDIDYEIDGILIETKTNEIDDLDRKKLLRFYKDILADKLTDKRELALIQLVSNMTQNRAKEMQKARLLTYAKALMPEITDSIIEVLDAIADEIDDLVVEINGNKFIYAKDSLNIKDYEDRLSELGNDSKGNTWHIYLDNEKELVIY